MDGIWRVKEPEVSGLLVMPRVQGRGVGFQRERGLGR